MTSDKDTILKHRLPSRMRELHAFIQMAETLESGGHVPIQVVTASQTFTLSNPIFLWHPLADSAALMSRALLHFLGIGMSSGNLCAANYRLDDITMSHVTLGPVAVIDALAGWSIPPADVEALLKLCITTGHKVSGHLTKESAETLDASIERSARAFGLVNDLVNREVYKKLGEQPVEFTVGSPYGYIT